MPTPNLTITINADTAEASRRVQDFYKDLMEGAGKVSGLNSLFDGFAKSVKEAFTVSNVVDFARDALSASEDFRKAMDDMGKAAGQFGKTVAPIGKAVGDELAPALKSAAGTISDLAGSFKMVVGDGAQVKAVLGEIAGAVAAYKAAKGIASFGNLLGGVNSWKELGLAVTTYLGHLRTVGPATLTAFATSPVVGFTAYLTALVLVIQTGIEAWKAWKAKQQEALSAGQVASSTPRLASTAREMLDSYEKAKVISAETAAIYRSQIVEFLKMDPEDSGFANDRMRALLHDLQKLVGPKPAEKPKDAPSPAAPSDDETRLVEAKNQTLLRMQTSFDELATAQNEAAFAKRQITLEKYFAKKKELLNSDADAQEKAQFSKLDLVEKQQADLGKKPKADQTDAERVKLADLEIQKEEILANLGVLHEHRKAEEVRLDQQLYEAQQRRAEQEQRRVEEEGRRAQEAKRVAEEAKRQANEAEATKSKLLQDQPKQTPNAAAKNTGFIGEFRHAMDDIKKEWGSWSKQMATSFKNVFHGAISSISGGITGLIMQTKTWKQALTEIGTSILTSIVSAIVEMGVKWVATQLMAWLFGQSLQEANVAAAAGQAALYSAAWATPATLATIASYGAAAAEAPGLIAIAETATLAQSVAPRRLGGPVYGASPYLVGEEGPELFVPNSSGMIVPHAQTHSMVGGAGEVHVHVWDDGSKIADHMANNPKVRHIVTTISGQIVNKFRR